MSESDTVICGEHGETPATFVCRHVCDGVACGFHASAEAPDDPWPDAWCDLCEEAFQAAGGEWNEESEAVANIKLLCTHCYEEARARNRAVPHLARGAGARLTDDEAADLIHHAVHEARALQTASNERSGWLDMPRWNYDGEAGTLTFSDSTKQLIADVRLVGSFSTNTNTFQSGTTGTHPKRRSSGLPGRRMSSMPSSNSTPCFGTRAIAFRGCSRLSELSWRRPSGDESLKRRELHSWR